MELLIELHDKWMKTGRLPELGLCGSFHSKYVDGKYLDTFLLFYPTSEDKMIIKMQGGCPVFWASGLPEGDFNEYIGYTDLRQTIVLFIAAMHDEL